VIFLNLKKNHSLQLARNAHGRTPEGIQAHIDNGKRLGQLRKEWALASRTSKTALMGGWTRAEQFEELTLMLPSLRLDMTSQAFEKSQRAAKCVKEGCLSRVFGKDAAENYLMAADVVLREVCPGKNPLEMAARGGKKITAGAEKLYNSNQDIVWRHGYMDRLVETIKNSRGRVNGCICIQCGDVKLETGKKRSEMMVHGPCTRGPDSGARLQENFYWFCARKLTDLPYSMARIFLYRAVRSSMDKEPGNESEKIAHWKGLLEWSG
jgi:hypothetical protein